MSIYSTIGSFYIRARSESKPGEVYHRSSTFYEIVLQAVPAHIGSPDELDEGEKDPYPWLPPPVASKTGNESARAVVVVGPNRDKGTERSGQEYVAPLFVITGAEYEKITYTDIHYRIAEALRKQGYEIDY